MMKLVILVLTLLSFQAYGGEYDEISARVYQAQKAAAGPQTLAGYAAHSEHMKRFLQNYIHRNGGDPNQGSCTVYSNYSCDGGLCTPHSTPTVDIQALGSPGLSFVSCDFSLDRNRACKAGRHVSCNSNTHWDQRVRCANARVIISCADRQTGEQTFDYIASLNDTPVRAKTKRR